MTDGVSCDGMACLSKFDATRRGRQIACAFGLPVQVHATKQACLSKFG